MPTPHASNQWVVRQYETIAPSTTNRSHPTAQCRHCHSYERMASKIAELKTHLLTCPAYQRKAAAGILPPEDRPPQQQKQQQQQGEPSTTAATTTTPTRAPTQTTPSSSQTLSSAQQQSMERLCATAVTQTGESAALFQQPAMVAYLKALNPAFVPPSRARIEELLLLDAQRGGGEEGGAEEVSGANASAPRRAKHRRPCS